MLWRDEQYTKMQQQVGKNEVEREFLTKLKAGATPLECMKQLHISQEEYSNLMKRAKVWEQENLCVNLKKE